MPRVSELRNRFPGEAVHVFGSGVELNQLDIDAFDGYITVAMNRVPLVWPLEPTFALTKYHADARELLRDAHFDWLVVARGDRGYLPPEADEWTGPGYVFDHAPMMPHGTFNVAEHWPTSDDELVVGPTVQMTAMHFAAHLGAREIVMHGCTGHGHVDGYYPSGVSRHQAVWLDDIRGVVQVTAREIERRYPTRIVWCGSKENTREADDVHELRA